MYNLLLSARAYSCFTNLQAVERDPLREVLLSLKRNPGLGTELWGRERVYIYRAAGFKMVYSAEGSDVQVVSISRDEYLTIPRRNKVAAVILAAGRTGHGNILLILRLMESFIDAGIMDITVVLGYQAERVKRELKDRDVKVVVNPDYELGLSRSMKCGLRMVSGDTAAVALALGNRPFITPEVISKLVSLYQNEKTPIIAPAYHQIRGHPVIFDTALIPELLKVRGNSGGKEVIQRHLKELKQVEVPDSGILKHSG